MDNNEQKEKVKAAFDMASDGYDCPGLRFFAESAAHLVSILGLRGDENILDMATGTGHVAIAAAQKLTDGSVIGIDLSDRMLEKARTKATENALSNIKFKQGDIEKTSFEDGPFDVACCAFGLFFLPVMENGLNCISKVVKPGGKVLITSFTNALMEPLSSSLLERLKKYSINPPPLSWKRLDTPEKINALLSKSGFQDVTIESKQMGYYLKDSNEWWNVLWNSGYRGLLSQLSEKDLKEFKNDHMQEVNSFTDEKGLWLDIEVLFALCKNG